MGLWETLVETTGTNATRYLHDPRGLLSQQRPDTNWQWALNDGLGSVRGMLNSSLSPQDSRLYAPYGETTQLSGTSQSAYGYTGEATDGNGLVYLRARYYAPGIGQFVSVDPLETANRYAYVGGNVVNATDPSGLVVASPRALRDGGSGSPIKRAPTKAVPASPVRTQAVSAYHAAVSSPAPSSNAPTAWELYREGERNIPPAPSALQTASELYREGERNLAPESTEHGGKRNGKQGDKGNSRKVHAAGCTLPEGYGSGDSTFVLSDCVQTLLDCYIRNPVIMIGVTDFRQLVARAQRECDRVAEGLVPGENGCTVEVRAYDTSALLNHTFIVFTGCDGTQYGYSGQPQILAEAEGLIDQISGNPDAYGILTIHTGIYGTNFVDFDDYESQGGPRTIVNRESDTATCNSIKRCLDSEAQRIANLPPEVLLYYPITGPNSNTVTRTLLHNCGLDESIPRGDGDFLDDAPGWENASLE
jgi:RHS repeat-associated protein